MIASILRALGRLPLGALYALGAFITWVTLRILRWHVPLARKNLANSFPERSEREREAILVASYRAMGQVFAEALWGWQRGGGALAERVVIDNRDLIERYVRDRQSVVLLTAHVCNWEWLLLSAGAQLRIPIDPIYKRVKEPSVERYLVKARSRDGGRPIELGDLLPELMLRVGTPRAYGMLADQTPPRDAPKHWIRMLNQDTAFHFGMGKVAQFLDGPVLYVAMRRLRRGYYAAHLHVLAEPPYDDDPETLIATRYAERLEAEVRANPADWLWVHRKWKYPKPATEEPAASSRTRRRRQRASGETAASSVTTPTDPSSSA